MRSQQQRHVVSGNKRGFSDTIDGFSEVTCSVYTAGNWRIHVTSDSQSLQSVGQGKCPGNSGMNVVPSSMSSGACSHILEFSGKILQEDPCATNGTSHNHKSASENNSSTPAPKAQVVGWPPIRSFRKNSLATTPKNNDELDGKLGPSALLVKVSMDGAPYQRRVDLRTHSMYQELSTALEKMFSCFTIGQCQSQGALGRILLSETYLRDLLHGSEYVLTYEDKEDACRGCTMGECSLNRAKG